MDKINRICRFLSLEDARYVLKNPSELCLNSLWYYREIEGEKLEKSKIKDPLELIIKTKEGTGELLNNFLVSCWTILENNRIRDEDWQIFPCKNDLAVVSTVEKVDKFLKEKCKLFLNHEIFMEYQHHKVIYYSSENEILKNLKKEGMIKKIPNDKDEQRMKLLLYAPFLKHKEFQHQREYRFVFRVGNSLYLKSLVLYNNFIYHDDSIPKYIDEIIINLNNSVTKEIKKLAIESGMGNKLKYSNNYLF